MYLELANDIAAILLVETSILQTVHNFCMCIFHPAPGVLKLQRKTLCHLLHGPKLMTESFWVRSPFSLVTRTRASIAFQTLGCIVSLQRSSEGPPSYSILLLLLLLL